MIDILDNRCCGCFACLNICPKNAITMSLDSGFYKASINHQKCVNCGLCSQVCCLQLDVKSKLSFPLKVFGGIARDKKVWTNSTSGGAFQSICKCFGDDNTIVFGTVLDNSFNTFTTFVRGISNTTCFSGSKYVQSYVGTSYEQCKKHLENGKKVIFCGTPCQIFGLKSYLKRPFDNLLCIDLVCHGVPSPVLFKKHISYLESLYKQRIVSFRFRKKVLIFGRYIDYSPEITFENGKRKILFNDRFTGSFLSGVSLNDSCANCLFKTNHRIGDITIGDLKQSWRMIKTGRADKNYSLISINTDKGMRVVEKLNEIMRLTELNIDEVNKYNLSFYKLEIENPQRQNFLDSFNKNYALNNSSIETIYDDYAIRPRFNYLSYYIPGWLKRVIRRKHE